jgi:hypothetical protein
LGILKHTSISFFRELKMKYLVAIHRLTGYDGTIEGPEMARAIDEVNDEMVAKGIRIFVGGLRSEGLAKSVRRNSEDGSLTVTDGPYLETNEHIGGLWVLECATPEEAVEWGRKAADACRCSVEVRPFY